jgi:transposase
MSNTGTVTYIGVDVAKAKLDYHLGKAKGEHGQTPNTAEGHATLVKPCNGTQNPCVVCEATGGCEENLLRQPGQSGIAVKRAHPNRVRAFAPSEGLHAKTDRIDAELLCRHGAARPREKPWKAPREAETQLRSLLDIRENPVSMRTQVRNRREHADATQGPWLDRQTKFLDEEIAKADQAIDGHLAADEQLRTDANRLQTVCGIGRNLAANVLAHLPELRELSAKQAASLAGVAPHPHSSGSRERRRRVQGGRTAVKKALYMSAVSAIQHNRILKTFNERLKAKGKPGKVRLVAVMRKLIHLIHRLLSNPNFSLA